MRRAMDAPPESAPATDELSYHLDVAVSRPMDAGAERGERQEASNEGHIP